jgi:hypothetical protein
VRCSHGPAASQASGAGRGWNTELAQNQFVSGSTFMIRKFELNLHVLHSHKRRNKMKCTWDQHSGTGRIMSMKKSNDTIGNRTCGLPVCSAVPQPLRHRVPHPEVSTEAKMGKDLRRNRYEVRTWMIVTVCKWL